MSTKRKKIRVIQSTVFNTNWQINFKRGWGGGGLHIQNFTKLYENVVWKTIRRSSGCENCHLKLIDNVIIIVLFLFSIFFI